MKLPPVLLLLANSLALCGTLPAAAQQRPLTAADFPKVVPKVDESFLQLKGKDLTEKILLAPYDGMALRLALSYASPEFLKGLPAEKLIAELSALRSESMNELLPDILAPINKRSTSGIRGGVPGALLPYQPDRLMQPLVVHPWAFFAAVRTEAQRLPYGATFERQREFKDDNNSLTAVNEYETVAEGMTANVREEITTSTEGRYIIFRHLKRETVEQNDDPKALGRYVVERGTMDSESGTNEIRSDHPRRLRPTNTHRVTTEIIREAKVERCPNAGGITRGETLVSFTIRGTAAAMRNGAPLVLEIVSPGKATGHVDNTATLTGFDWEVSARSRMESLNAGENFQLAQTFTMHLRNMNTCGAQTTGSGEEGELIVSGVGTTDGAGKVLSLQNLSMGDAAGPLLLVYDRAEAEWRGGKCVELVVPLGTEYKVRPGETRRFVVEARHRYEPPPLAVPVIGTPAGGTLTPTTPVPTPSAAFTFKSDNKDGGVVTLKSVSKRGIAKDVKVWFGTEDKPFYKVTVDYIKTVRKDFNMNSDEDRVAFKSSEQSSQDVAYSFSLLHYLSTEPKEGEQIIIMSQFEDDPEYQKSKKGKTVVLHNEGYSEYIIKGKPIEAAGPFGALTAKGKEEQQRYFSSSPQPPSVSFMFKNNELVFFGGGVEFPEVEDGLSPVSSSFGLNEKDKGFPVKPKKVTDPNSPYKWLYEFEYRKEDGYNKQGKVFKQGSKEVETATVKIWKSFDEGPVVVFLFKHLPPFKFGNHFKSQN